MLAAGLIQDRLFEFQSYTPKRSKDFVLWNSKQYRCYKRMHLGLRKHKGEDLRFLTFTSAADMHRTMYKCFNCVLGRIRRRTPYHFVKEGYLNKRQLPHYFKDRKYFRPLEFEFMKVKTKEGIVGVFHILFFGDYLPQQWLSDVWFAVTGTAMVVDIRSVGNKRYQDRKTASYMMNQYVLNQDKNAINVFEGFSYSRNWVFKGFAGAFDSLSKEWRHMGMKWPQVYITWDAYIWWLKHPPPLQRGLNVDVEDIKIAEFEEVSLNSRITTIPDSGLNKNIDWDGSRITTALKKGKCLNCGSVVYGSSLDYVKCNLCSNEFEFEVIALGSGS